MGLRDVDLGTRDFQIFAARYADKPNGKFMENPRNAGVIRTHVTVKASVCCVLVAGDPVSGAQHAGGRDGAGHVILPMSAGVGD